MRRAQRAAEAAMDAARELLRRAERTARLERRRRAADGRAGEGSDARLRRARHELPTTSSSRRGAQGAVGHDMGSGPIAAGRPVVVDIWPRDNESFMSTAT